MPNKGDIYLGAVGSESLLSAYGRKLSISDEQITREGRTASGRYVKDVITTKKEFNIRYDLIGGNDLASLLTIYGIDDELSLQIYHTSDEGGTTREPGANYDQYYVLMSALSRTRELLASDGLWSGVSVVLKEV